MKKIYRNIIKIDEDKCNGCGQCIPSCKEGALAIINGKAKLVSEIYCDGLGACLGTCPNDAISIEKREASEFDEKAATEHQDKIKKDPLPCGCPGTMTKTLKKENIDNCSTCNINSELRNWPIQLKLIPANAPYLKGSDIVLLSDCSAVAYPNLHNDILKNRIIIMACPKLDDNDYYIDKLADIFSLNNIRTIEIVMMEVPCCSGLSEIVNKAMKKSKTNINKIETTITIEGQKK